jgi:DNA polymerase III delta subunit
MTIILITRYIILKEMRTINSASIVLPKGLITQFYTLLFCKLQEHNYYSKQG